MNRARNKAVVVFILFIILITLFSYAQEAFRYDAHNRRDPFIPLVDKDGNLLPEIRLLTAVEEINLEGILWDENGESFVIISGNVLKTGDFFADYKVIKIERNRVVLTRAGEEITIDLSSEEE